MSKVNEMSRTELSDEEKQRLREALADLRKLVEQELSALRKGQEIRYESLRLLAGSLDVAPQLLRLLPTRRIKLCVGFEEVEVSEGKLREARHAYDFGNETDETESLVDAMLSDWFKMKFGA
jgi:uncharacterized membrane protein